MSDDGCLICHQGPHRFGTTDPHHDYDAMGCVNMLLPEIDSLRSQVERYREVVEAATRIWMLYTLSSGPPGMLMTREELDALGIALARLDADPPREPTERNEG